MKTIVQFSGGKDSLASLLWVRNNLTTDFITVFADTGWESPETYDYIEDIKNKLNLNLVTVKSKKFKDFLDLAKKKKRFPSVKARFCTTELKSKPMIDYILDDIQDDVLIVQGIRAEESNARKLMQKQCTYFKFYHQPYGKNKKGKPKYHTYRKKDVLAFTDAFADDILRPVFEWTAQEVIDYILKNGLEPNPLYKKGFKRVGCYPCIMSNRVDIKSLKLTDPERITFLEQKEKELGSSFFGPDKIPAYAYKGDYPLITDVVKYVINENQTMLFETDTSCMSFYGLCE